MARHAATTKSGVEAVLRQPRCGIDRVAAVGVDLEMEAGSGGVAGRADRAEVVPGLHPLPGLDTELALVAVPQHGPVIEPDDGLVAEGAVVRRRDDHAGSDGADLGAFG